MQNGDILVLARPEKYPLNEHCQLLITCMGSVIGQVIPRLQKLLKILGLCHCVMMKYLFFKVPRK